MAGYSADIALVELDDPWIGEELTFVGFDWTSETDASDGYEREPRVPIESVDGDLVETYAEGTNFCTWDMGGSGLVSDGAGGWLVAAVPVYTDPDGECLGARLAPTGAWPIVGRAGCSRAFRHRKFSATARSWAALDS